ncbi:GroES-like protein [Hypoxylon trugodes]|uniref:GroES-like protein n=1 Tax=Hypoxylon trugodes TaxID=326681 RepID=UPI00219A345B|nr:GroES-like protein [Hypoxylon trugodes]KAI1394352.1 GroES-like protein [Hypoxylon trugodes]
MAPSNQAAFLTGPKVPLEVREAPYTPPGPNELVVKSRAVAVNVVDPYKQILGDALLPYIKWPCIQGEDLAGDVIEVGSAVTRFKAGDRVTSYAVGTMPFANRQAEGAFQNYTVVREHMTTSFPSSVSYERVSVLPLCLATAAYGLFHHGFLGLDLPTSPAASPKGEAIVITSGSSSVGASAIQLAVAAGYEVYSTASPRNFELVRRIGASGVFDYHEDNCADAIINALKGKKIVGALAINAGGVAISAKVLRGTDGVKYIADAGPPPPEGYPEDIKSRFIDLLDLGEPDSVVGKVFRDFLPKALESGQLVPEPEPWIVGEGLNSLQEAYDIRLKGVSAKKVVVVL